MENEILKDKLLSLANNDGLTLIKYKSVTYKTGYQVGIQGRETTSVEKAVEYINEFNGNCGVWYSDGIYYIDESVRIKSKKEALNIGRLYNQISILKWSDMSLIYC